MSFELILPFLRPIESLLLDDSVSEIMGNPDGLWWYERRGKLYAAPEVKFETRQLLTSLDVIANKLGRKLGADKPLLNAQLPDGAVLPPSFLRSSVLIRLSRFGSSPGLATRCLSSSKKVRWMSRWGSF